MRRNRLITILLCMTLTISAFTGCGKKDTVAEAEPEAQTEKNYVNSTEFVVEPTETAAETETRKTLKLQKRLIQMQTQLQRLVPQRKQPRHQRRALIQMSHL